MDFIAIKFRTEPAVEPTTMRSRVEQLCERVTQLFIRSSLSFSRERETVVPFRKAAIPNNEQVRDVVTKAF